MTTKATVNKEAAGVAATTTTALLTPQFRQAYQRLNAAQQLAVDTIEGPVMVIAGPGTGKTQVLTTRIANILVQTDARPENILALTFTDSAAKNMRDRLIKMIGRDGYYVRIMTFHAFCSQVISEFGEYFPIKHDSQPVTELEKYELFRHLFETLELEVLRPPTDKYFYLKKAIANISQLKKEGVDPAEFTELAEREMAEWQQQVEAGELKKTEATKKQRQNQKNLELARIYQAYEQNLRQSARFDFDDMIMLTLAAFRREPDLLAEYQEKLQYILVDEYQDTNSSQNQIVALLASHWGEQANVFVVGDPNQSIFRFQGASLENVLGFRQQYPQAAVIQLAEGYRCTQLIYQAAGTVMAGAADPQVRAREMIAEIKAAKGTGGAPIEFMRTSSDETELIYVIKKIQALVAGGAKLDEIAILYRNNADSERLMAALEKFDLPYELEGGSNLLKQELMRQLLTLLQLINELEQPTADGLLWQVLFYDWLGFGRLTVMKMGRICGSNYLSLSQVLSGDWAAWQVIDREGAVSEAEFGALRDFYRQLVDWKAANENLVFLHWLEIVVKKSRFLDWLLTQDNRIFLLNCVTTLFDQVRALNGQDSELKLAGFWRSIQTMLDQDLQLNVADLSQKKESVKLCTVHKAKGREWTYVFVVELVDGKWGNNKGNHNWGWPAGILQNQDLSQSEKNDDERRLFYVALTRAKQQVFLSFPQQVKQRGRLAEKNLCLFGAELLEQRPEYFRELTDDEIEAEELVAYLTKIVTPAERRPNTAAEREYLAGIVQDLKLSITELNAYLHDPKEFVYQYLLKIPRETVSPHFAFGNAIHEALYFLYRPLVAEGAGAEKGGGDRGGNGESGRGNGAGGSGVGGGGVPELEQVKTVFRKRLQKELLTKVDRQLRLEQGEKVLTEYYEAYFGGELGAGGESNDKREGNGVKQGSTGEKLAEKLPAVLGLEQSFGKQFKVVLDEDILLYGRIDRIDWLDAEQQTVAVIDYKTGAPKSMGFIEATAKSAILSEKEQTLPDSVKGKYKRQLLFYKLLTDLDRTFAPTATAGFLDFVEKRSLAKHALRKIEFTEEELEDLKDLIRTVMKEIRSLDFLADLEF